MNLSNTSCRVHARQLVYYLVNPGGRMLFPCPPKPGGLMLPPPAGTNAGGLTPVPKLGGRIPGGRGEGGGNGR